MSAARRAPSAPGRSVRALPDPGNPGHHEEFFGPVAVLYRVADEEQAVRVTDRLEAGTVVVNAVGAESAELPFGG